MFPSTIITMRQPMTDEETRWMDHYGITSEQKNIFRFRGIAYDRLQDAINYAKTVTDRENSSEIHPKKS
jgi:hypothetical protein